MKACALCRPLLVCFDGFRGYVEAFRKAFRTPLREGKRGRPRLIPWPNMALHSPVRDCTGGQVVKQTVGWRLVGIRRRIVQGGKDTVQALSLTGLIPRRLRRDYVGTVEQNATEDVIAQYVWNQGQDNQYTQLHVEQLKCFSKLIPRPLAAG